MASAHVLPSNSSAAGTKKKGHLEMGRKKLEEFRKKKAEERGRKLAAVGQVQQSEVDQDAKLSQNHENVGGHSNHADKPFQVKIAEEEKNVKFPQDTDTSSSNATYLKPPILSNSNFGSYNHLREDSAENEVSISYERSALSELANGYYEHQKDEVNDNYYKAPEFGSGPSRETDQPDLSSSIYPEVQVDDLYREPSSKFEVRSEATQKSPSKFDHGTSEFQFMGVSSDSLLDTKKNSFAIPSDSHVASLNSHELASGAKQHASVISSFKNTMKPDGGRSMIADSISRHLNLDSSPWHQSEPSSHFAFKSSSIDQPFPYGTTSNRSRSSFLDSLGIARVSPTPLVPVNEAEKVDPALSNSTAWVGETHILSVLEHDVNTVQHSPVLKHPVHSTKVLSPESSTIDENPYMKELGSYSVGKDFDLPVVKKDEDFAALEQHIEDLTQEKFSLQRALETSRALAESLAVENSSLTDSYNQQGEVVSQLRSELESLQQEIQAQMMELESFKMEYANAKLECNAADERAKVLASEVIGLEEKALRLRSNELKLEKQLEKLTSEIASYKRKVSSLEKERQDFLSTIDALQEEKKLMQSKLRKDAVIGTMTSDVGRKDISTSTDDLGSEASDLMDGESSLEESVSSRVINSLDSGLSFLPSDNASGFALLNEERGILLDSIADTPHEHLRMIDNIRSLISELYVEKEELLQKLTIESSNNSKLKDLNKDLSQKLEAQTQRLELLTAQRMANDNVTAKSTNTRVSNDTTEFADEGDEVVERVFSWIMKLFPGGPSKRRTSKLL